MNNTVIGTNASVADGCSYCFVFGDGCVAHHSEQFVIGRAIFGTRIPDDVRAAIKANPVAFEWVIRRLVRHVS